MEINVSFYSYFKDLTGCAQTRVSLAPGSTLSDLLESLGREFPKLGAMRNALLMAVGVDYQDRSYVLKQGDQVSLFPPVQGG